MSTVSMTEVTNIRSESELLSLSAAKMRRNENDTEYKNKVKQQSTGCVKQLLSQQQQLQPKQLSQPNLKQTAIIGRRMLLFRYKDEHPFEQRIAETTQVREMYPERLPIVVEKIPGSSINDLRKAKFLVPDCICVDQFIWILKEKLSFPFDKEIRIFISNQKTPPDPNASLLQVFKQFKDSDGFLYVAYSDADFTWQ